MIDVPEFIITDNAAKRIVFLMQNEGEGYKMRISVSGGGCSGFKYNFEMSKDQDDSDVVLTKNNAIIILDDLSYHSFLKGSTLDYQQDLSGAAFVITNPNSSAKCGCGNSFAI